MILKIIYNSIKSQRELFQVTVNFIYLKEKYQNENLLKKSLSL